MGGYKLKGLKGLFLSDIKDVMKKKGAYKGEIGYKLETSLEDLSIEGLFETNPVVKKKKEEPTTPKVVEIKKPKKKGNELI